MPGRDVTLPEFLSTVFDLPLPDDGSQVCLTRKDERGKWENYPATERRMRQYREGQHPWYFCVCTVGPPTETGFLSRSRDALREVFCLVLDDIGTKAPPPPVDPSWKLQSSAGNWQYGYLISPMDMTDPEELAYYEGCVAALGEAGYGDKGAGGAYRVMRVPGSVNPGKGDFVSSIHREDWHPGRHWELEDLMAELGVEPLEQPLRELSELNPDREVNDPVLDWLTAEGLVTGKKDARFVEILCPWREEHGSGGDVAGYTPVGYEREEFDGAFSCMHEHCKGRGKAEFAEWVHEQRTAEEVSTTDLQDIVIQGKTEDAVAAYAAHALAGKYLYAIGGGWMRWTGTHWKPDSEGSVRHEVRRFARWHNKDDGKTMAKASFVSGVMRFMEADPVFVRDLGSFDADEFLLGTPRGTIDLRTGLLRAADPADLISKLTRVSLGGARARFDQFLLEVMDGDAEAAAFLQRSLGAMLSGAVNEHWLMFWIGQGRNGKNTLGDLVQWLLGDYATVMQSEALMAKNRQDHPTEIMTLRGRRMVTSSEISEGAYWNESRLNQVTGDAVLTGRYMRGDFVEFRRTHKHLIYGNHRPALRNVSAALKARVKVVPFTVSFVGREDPELGAQLREEAGGVLSWLVEGHMMWLEGGQKIGTCELVRAATEDYFTSQSTIEAFLEERCMRTLEGWSATSSLYEDYRFWKLDNGEHPVSKIRFSEQLSGVLQKHDKTAARGFRGVILKTATTASEVAQLVKKQPK